MNASDVIRMQQTRALLKGTNVNTQKSYGPVGLCGKAPGCCFDCSDTIVGTGNCVGGAGDLVYQGGVFFGCKKPTVVAMTIQNPVICPSFVETETLERAGGGEDPPCKCKCPVATTEMTKQTPMICPQVVLDVPLE